MKTTTKCRLPVKSTPRTPAPAATLQVGLRVQRGNDVALAPGRVQLLHAIGETDSITGAARQLGVSYMHAWSLIQLMNGCFRLPLVAVARGGKTGGGAALTKEGRDVLGLYDEIVDGSERVAAGAWKGLRAKLSLTRARARADIPLALYTQEDNDADLMEQSIRNELPGTVKSIVSDKVLTEVIIRTAIGEIASIVTTRSVKEMRLKVGDPASALVKATNVSVRRERA